MNRTIHAKTMRRSLHKRGGIQVFKTQRRQHQKGGGESTLDSNTLTKNEIPSINNLAHRVFINTPLLLASKAISHGEGLLGIDGLADQGTEEVQKHIRAITHVVRAAVNDPTVVGDLTDTLRQSGDIIINTIEDIK